MEPGDLLWGKFLTHDRGIQSHPALVIRVDDEIGERSLITVVLGSSKHVSLSGHPPTEFVIMKDDVGFSKTGLRESTRFDLRFGYRQSFRVGELKAFPIGTVRCTPSLIKRLYDAYLNAKP